MRDLVINRLAGLRNQADHLKQELAQLATDVAAAPADSRPIEQLLDEVIHLVEAQRTVESYGPQFTTADPVLTKVLWYLRYARADLANLQLDLARDKVFAAAAAARATAPPAVEVVTEPRIRVTNDYAYVGSRLWPLAMLRADHKIWELIRTVVAGWTPPATGAELETLATIAGDNPAAKTVVEALWRRPVKDGTP